MSDNIIQVNQEIIHTELKDLVRTSVEEALNAMLDAEADKLSMQSVMHVTRSGKAIDPVIMSALSLQLPERSISKCRSSRDLPLKHLSSNVTSGVKPPWKKL